MYLEKADKCINRGFNGKNKNLINFLQIIVYYVMRSKNEVLCAAAGRLAAERSET
jgi:hypothetical protein